MRRSLTATLALTVLATTALLASSTAPAGAHNYCQNHNQIEMGTRAWSPSNKPIAAFFVDGVKGSVDVPGGIRHKAFQSYQLGGGPTDGFFTAAMITLSNQESMASGFADEISLGWYAGQPFNNQNLHPGTGMGFHPEMEWTTAPTWFMRETIPNPSGEGGHVYRYQWIPHEQYSPLTGHIPVGFHKLRIERRNSMYNNSSDDYYDLYINDVRRASTVRKHRVGNTPMAGGEVHGFPCVQMYSVFRENRLNNSTSATLRYYRYDHQTWYYFPQHSQRMYTFSPQTFDIVEGPWGNASCFREQTLGHIATGYAYGPIDDGPGNYCPVPYT